MSWFDIVSAADINGTIGASDLGLLDGARIFGLCRTTGCIYEFMVLQKSEKQALDQADDEFVLIAESGLSFKDRVLSSEKYIYFFDGGAAYDARCDFMGYEYKNAIRRLEAIIELQLKPLGASLDFPVPYIEYGDEELTQQNIVDKFASDVLESTHYIPEQACEYGAECEVTTDNAIPRDPSHKCMDLLSKKRIDPPLKNNIVKMFTVDGEFWQKSYEATVEKAIEKGYIIKMGRGFSYKT